jgi:metal-dependent hydrolase (beta-lactamase superfamily II)
MKVISLQSGSNGNCIYVEANSVTLLFDAGISASDVQERLALHGRDASAVDAVLISHDHIDHCRSMGILNRSSLASFLRIHRRGKGLRQFVASECSQ